MLADPLIVLSGGTDLVVDPHGPDPMVVQVGDSVIVTLPDEPLDLEFAAVGLPGRDGADGAAQPIEAVAAATMIAGMPVAIDRTTGQLITADAGYKPAAFVAGLLAADVAQGFVGSAASGRLTLADWSEIAGAAQLVPGVPYFLGLGGGLTSTAPASDCVVLVGRALNATTLLIDPQPPIQL